MKRKENGSTDGAFGFIGKSFNTVKDFGKSLLSEGVKAVGLEKTSIGEMLVLESEGKKYYK